MGGRRCVLAVPAFDFTWELVYHLSEPLPVRRRQKAPCDRRLSTTPPTARNNPDPSAEVKWGNLTTDEMMFASIGKASADSIWRRARSRSAHSSHAWKV
jgi:hypothetical protein